jgi:hypothetical protein
MKKYIALLLVLSCMFGLVACGANKHTCRPLDNTEKVDLQSSSLTEPFVTDEERDELLNKAIKKYLNNLDNKSVSFTYEITGTQLGVYEEKETILYWVKIVYGEGFTTVLGFIIQ